MDHRLRSLPRTIHLLFLLTFIALFHDLVLADPPYQFCPNNSNYPLSSSFQNNLNVLLSLLSSNTSSPHYYNTSIGNETDRVYGQYMCLNYKSTEECRVCLATASQDILNRCPNQTEAILWEDYCQLRYSDLNFFGQLDLAANLGKDNVIDVSDPKNFQSLVDNILRKLTNKAAFDPSAKMYATGETLTPYKDAESLYGLVQCTLDLSPDDCNKCLQTAIQNVSSCCYASRGARVFSRSCYLRYELYAFYEGANGPPPASKSVTNPKDSGRKAWTIVILAIVSALLVVVLLAISVYCVMTRKGTQTRKNDMIRRRLQSHAIYDEENTDMQQQNIEEGNDIKAQEFYIDLASIHAATDRFSDSNMLGEGGFGPVYKGILSDGKEVAIKRLSRCSEQGAREFTNEVLLILKLQHKNLVKLLGFCVDREEKLLAYEFMPNGSLDVILFDPMKREKLNWSRRLNIINGIARGILYLHEDSRLRIIHRDLKASNVLLDSHMNPKISDFGMARIFAGTDEGEANTARIVGTYGYMAPEYAMEGLYSVKSDVFSFGVLMLEIITGKKCGGFHQSRRAPSLQAYAWQLWNEGNALELMDPLLTDACPEEFLRCFNIALLCVQEDAFDRPSMSSVVVMLKGETVTIGQPGRPAFSVGRFTDHIESLAKSSSVNGLTISSIAPR